MTYMQRTLSFSTVLLALAGVSGCSDSSSSGDPKMVTQGRVETDPTMTDANGRCRVESDLELSAGTHLLLEATDGTNQASVVLLVEADGEMTAEPMTEETSLEAAVFESLSAVTFASGSETVATLADVSAALEARIDAEATVLTAESASAFNAYVSARANAGADAVSALDAATSVSATAEARADFDAALAEARSSGSLSVAAWATSVDSRRRGPAPRVHGCGPRARALRTPTHRVH